MKCQIQDALKLTARELDIRTAEEFSTLNLQIRLKFPFSVLPETFPIDSLGAYTNVSMTTDTLRTFQLHEDFATIDLMDCFEVKDMATLPSVSEARLLAVWTVLSVKTGDVESFSYSLTQSSSFSCSARCCH